MSRTPLIKPSAQREFDEATDWYTERSPQLASEFVAQVKRVFDAICAQPEIYGFVSDRVRAARTKTFSYAVYFYVAGSDVTVIAILHTSRDPAIWQNRSP